MERFCILVVFSFSEDVKDRTFLFGIPDIQHLACYWFLHGPICLLEGIAQTMKYSCQAFTKGGRLQKTESVFIEKSNVQRESIESIKVLFSAMIPTWHN